MIESPLQNEVAPVINAFSNPVDFAQRILGLDLHEGQRQWLEKARRMVNVLVCGRRWGKTFTAALQLLWYGLRYPNSRLCVVSVTLDQANICLDYVRYFLSQPYLSALVEDKKDTPFPVIKLRTGSEITARSTARQGIYLRGHHFHVVLVDEADYLSPALIDGVIRMTLADYGGLLYLVTTPAPVRTVAYREMQKAISGDPKVYYQGGSTRDNPYIDGNYVETMRDRMTTSTWLREIEGQYVEEESAVFAWENVRKAYEDSDYRLPLEPEPERRYVMGVDVAGPGQDWTVIVVLDATAKPYRLAAYERWQYGPFERLYSEVERLARKYSVHRIVIDATGMGAPVLEELEKRLR